MGWFKKSKSSKYADAMAKAAKYSAKAEYKDGGKYEAKAEKYAKKAKAYQKELEAEKAEDFSEVLAMFAKLMMEKK